MYKGLIVDDEPMICMGIEMMVNWKEHQISTIKIAHNGEEALKLIKEEPPQLLITDIRMPRMDGIQLVKAVRELGLDTHILVLSGYDDFEYVRTTMVLGIENYLLKPVNEEELNENVRAIVEKIQWEKEQKQRASMDQNLIRENVINRWLYGSISEKELQERAEFLGFNLDAPGYQPFMLKGLGGVFEANRDLKDQIFEVCSKILECDDAVCFCKNHSGEIVAVRCLENGEKTDNIILQCIQAVEEQLQLRLYALMGKKVEGYWAVPKSFQEIVKNGAFRYESKEDLLSSDKEHKKEISTAAGQMSPITIRMAQYALEHYKEEVSLKTLAQYFKGNAAYMGQTFKRDTGKSFSDYLKEIRIKKAKELLVCKDYKAKEIGVLVGFQNDTYFSATFKKETGLTPAEYRKEFLR